MLLLKAWPWWTDIYYSYQLYVAHATTYVLVYVLGFCGKAGGALWEDIVILYGPCKANGDSQVFVKLPLKSCLLKGKIEYFCQISDGWSALYRCDWWPSGQCLSFECWLEVVSLSLFPPWLQCYFLYLQHYARDITWCSVTCAQADTPGPAQKRLWLQGALQRGRSPWEQIGLQISSSSHIYRAVISALFTESLLHLFYVFFRLAFFLSSLPL